MGGLLNCESPLYSYEKSLIGMVNGVGLEMDFCAGFNFEVIHERMRDALVSISASCNIQSVERNITHSSRFGSRTTESMSGLYLRTLRGSPGDLRHQRLFSTDGRKYIVIITVLGNGEKYNGDQVSEERPMQFSNFAEPRISVDWQSFKVRLFQFVFKIACITSKEI